MRRAPHENVATVLVEPGRLAELELALVAHDLWVWPVATAPICVDGARQAFQVRRRLVESAQGRWDCAAAWVPVWVSFGESWGHRDGLVTWQARKQLYTVLDAFAAHLRYRRGLGGVAPLPLPRDRAS